MEKIISFKIQNKPLLSQTATVDVVKGTIYDVGYPASLICRYH